MTTKLELCWIRWIRSAWIPNLLYILHFIKTKGVSITLGIQAPENSLFTNKSGALCRHLVSWSTPIRDVRVGSELGQIGPQKRNKSGTFSHQCQYILAHRVKMYWNWSIKNPRFDLSHLKPIWPNLEQTLTSLTPINKMEGQNHSATTIAARIILEA